MTEPTRASASVDVGGHGFGVGVDVEADLDALRSLVDEVRLDPLRRDELLAWLREDHSVYSGRSASAVVRIRGWILATFESVGLPADALPFVIEELQNGHRAYAVAAAAKALRALERPLSLASFRPLLEDAQERMRLADEYVSFTAFGAEPEGATATTARAELEETLRRAEREHRAAACCDEDGGGIDAPLGVVRHARAERRALDREESASILLEDHDGSRLSFDDVVGRDAPVVLVFFYTRCDNPRKCSLTVSKLAQLADRIESDPTLAGRVRTGAITYDPGFDTPARLKAYGQARRWRFDPGLGSNDGPHHRLLRTTTAHGFDVLKRELRLGVGFVSSLVNRHRTELLVFDRRGLIAAEHTRVAWDADAVLSDVRTLVDETDPSEDRGRRVPTSTVTPARHAVGSLLATVAPQILIGFFPRCPVCWAAYLSVLGIAEVHRIPYSPWLLFVLAGLIVVQLWSALRRSRSKGDLRPFLLSLMGVGILLVGAVWLRIPHAAPVGVLTSALGSLSSVFQRARLPRSI